MNTAVAVRAEGVDADGWRRLELTYQDSKHAEWALWQLGIDAEALAPQSLRAVLHRRALAIANRYDESAIATGLAPRPARPPSPG
ncbi:WYL domain-containing protein [Prauserella cavernicola]|uniref:WYL domain-containing protein n=1 Tax=Prauserella cavernicola TaxID=2800127 RepID=UPI0035578A92